ncbi:hypothetical protein OK016_13115 [Vibrio chagasii]|nr:hypothetical protein [Vibrio chagasii]
MIERGEQEMIRNITALVENRSELIDDAWGIDFLDVDNLLRTS